mmetsp:Transcript_15880/g.41167  ORF Transcript_15880/g.41167 Transcript_15880/m.41167 type:complete len:282 (+) Transcript_15880:733-1578(+)
MSAECSELSRHRRNTRLRSRVATLRCSTQRSTRSGFPSATKWLTRSCSGSGSRLGSWSRRIGPSSLRSSAAWWPCPLNRLYTPPKSSSCMPSMTHRSTAMHATSWITCPCTSNEPPPSLLPSPSSGVWLPQVARAEAMYSLTQPTIWPGRAFASTPRALTAQAPAAPAASSKSAGGRPPRAGLPPPRAATVSRACRPSRMAPAQSPSSFSAARRSAQGMRRACSRLTGLISSMCGPQPTMLLWKQVALPPPETLTISVWLTGACSISTWSLRSPCASKTCR